jgi:hypothetical protein
MNLQELKKSNCIIFECISGSKAYGLSIEGSDEDIRGVFIMPKKGFYSFSFPEQIHDEKQNIIYYELRKFLDLLSKNNPNMLELLSIPNDCILFKHPLYEKIRPQAFLSMLCKDTFLNYAISQFKKAQGLNKKIVNPIEKNKKSPLDFCYVLEGYQSIPLADFLKNQKLSEKNCGLSLIPHMRDLYSIFYDSTGSYQGILRHDNSMEVALSSIPKGKSPIATMSFNQDGYSTYCKDYKEYWEWVENRNQNRFQNTVENGKNYDSKNMMHLFRLLDLVKNVGRKGELSLRSSEREQLLKIRRGEFSYQELKEKMERQVQDIEAIFKASNLPEKPNIEHINNLLIEIRTEFYQGRGQT